MEGKYLKMKKLSVIIPAYNEEESLPKLIPAAITILNRHYPDKYEILVIDDCSSDGTANVCLKLQKKNPALHFFRNKRNLGKNKTIMKALDMSNGGIVLFIDADFQYFPSDIPLLVSALNSGNDIVCGWRRDRSDNPYRKVMSYCFNTFNRMMFGIKIHDVNCGLKAFRRGCLKKLNLSYLQARWFFDTELLARAYDGGFKVAEIIVKHKEREEGKSKVSCFNLASETLCYAVLLKLSLMKNRCK